MIAIVARPCRSVWRHYFFVQQVSPNMTKYQRIVMTNNTF